MICYSGVDMHVKDTHFKYICNNNNRHYYKSIKKLCSFCFNDMKNIMAVEKIPVLCPSSSFCRIEDYLNPYLKSSAMSWYIITVNMKHRATPTKSLIGAAIYN